MSATGGRDLLAELSNAVAAYLNSMAAMADCLEKTYPDVGGPYRQRIHRLQWRVSFDATREAIKDSSQTLEAELKDYASVANRVLTERGVEMKRGILRLGDLIEGLAQRQDTLGNCLLHLAAQVENAACATALQDLAASVSDETTVMVAQMREQMIALDQRLAGTTSTDPVTGLINRRELERQIAAHKLHGSTFCLVLFELSGPFLSDQVMRLAGAKLTMKFRHRDWIARWGANQLAVLFMSGPEMAKIRTAEAVECLAGRYTLGNGETVLIDAQIRLVQPELAAA
jgi:GGDEF domain-containing protein